MPETCSWCDSTSHHLIGTTDSCCHVHYATYFAAHRAPVPVLLGFVPISGRHVQRKENAFN